ncbi:MAG TPA: HipA domain-containing protein, partial [Chitinophagaceae bacterium]|nr:HipA domain-containing protein [Chitinophagaceae bacterium]
MIELNVCPGTLREGYTTYSPKCIREVFKGSIVPHQSDLDKPADGGDTHQLKLHRRKLSFAQDGQYILKTAPADMINADGYTANAHLTMQLASEIFGIPTAPSALMFLKDGSLAYISKRVDIRKDGSSCLLRDFASLAGLNVDKSGSHYRYQLSYYEMSLLIDKYFPAAIVAKEQFFRTVVFNYLFSNGDAHLEKFALLDCEHNGDGRLTPAFDLVNTALHGDTGDLALLGGLYEKDFEKLS